MVRRAAWLVLLLVSAFGHTREIKACGDAAGWPPYTYELQHRVVGFDKDVLDALFQSSGERVSLILLPWKRCLHEVEAGRIDIAVSASRNAERAARFLLSEPYYRVRPGYVYLHSRYPAGLDYREAKESGAVICGARGYNYSGFDIENERVYRGTNTLFQLAGKLKAGRCDLFLARYEIIQGFDLTGHPLLEPDFRLVPVPDVKTDPFHFLVSRAVSDADELLARINLGIARLDQSGKLTQMLNAYLKPDNANKTPFLGQR